MGGEIMQIKFRFTLYLDYHIYSGVKYSIDGLQAEVIISTVNFLFPQVTWRLDVVQQY